MFIPTSPQSQLLDVFHIIFFQHRLAGIMGPPIRTAILLEYYIK